MDDLLACYESDEEVKIDKKRTTVVVNLPNKKPKLYDSDSESDSDSNELKRRKPLKFNSTSESKSLKAMLPPVTGLLPAKPTDVAKTATPLPTIQNEQAVEKPNISIPTQTLLSDRQIGPAKRPEEYNEDSDVEDEINDVKPEMSDQWKAFYAAAPPKLQATTDAPPEPMNMETRWGKLLEGQNVVEVSAKDMQDPNWNAETAQQNVRHGMIRVQSRPGISALLAHAEQVEKQNEKKPMVHKKRLY